MNMMKVKVSKKEYFRLPKIRKFRRIVRRACRKAGGWLEPNKGIRTKIILKDKFGNNIFKSRRYKARMLKESFAEYYDNECVTLNKKGGEYEVSM